MHLSGDMFCNSFNNLQMYDRDIQSKMYRVDVFDTNVANEYCLNNTAAMKVTPLTRHEAIYFLRPVLCCNAEY